MGRDDRDPGRNRTAPDERTRSTPRRPAALESVGGQGPPPSAAEGPTSAGRDEATKNRTGYLEEMVGAGVPGTYQSAREQADERGEPAWWGEVPSRGTGDVMGDAARPDDIAVGGLALHGN